MKLSGETALCITIDFSEEYNQFQDIYSTLKFWGPGMYLNSI